ncbi:hypothetical protein B0H10DRAFT_310518 [Mycena sp. CBHHK59/15]|nr:hypothetical protein B0H10DRAFT_310518 [Mycena sp. CBHHK59/15]
MVSPSRFGLSSAVLAFRVLSGTTQASAHLANITIDDTNSTFWTWAGSWHAVTPSTPCTNCFAQPDPSKAYDSTWHDGSLRSGSFSFQGTAVYIYGIDVFDPANISFSLNDPALTSFHYYAGQDYQYNSLFFQAAGLTSDVQHTVTWVLETSAAGGGAGLFDYAVVTVDEPDPTTSASASNTSSTSASTSSTASSSMLSTS